MEYVYFFRHNDSEYVKIGKTVNAVKKRFDQFKVYAPLGAYIVGFINTEDCSELERELHAKYDNFRFEGEFFKLTDKEVHAEIKNHDTNYEVLVTMINQLIADHNCTMLEIKSYLKSRMKIKEVDINKDINITLLKFLEDNKGNKLTSTEICEELIKLGYNTNPYRLGRVLKNDLGLKKVIQRDGKNVAGYYQL